MKRNITIATRHGWRVIEANIWNPKQICFVFGIHHQWNQDGSFNNKVWCITEIESGACIISGYNIKHMKDEIIRMIRKAGFDRIKLLAKQHRERTEKEWGEKPIIKNETSSVLPQVI